MSIENNRQTILDLLKSKSILKQDVFALSKSCFTNLRGVIYKEIAAILPLIKDDRIRLSAEDKSDFETMVMIGSDALLFQMHSNVFLLEDEHPLWKAPYLKKNTENGFFGVIHIYNFLAESIINNRFNDSGFLIGKIYVNKENKVFVEGKGQLGFLFKDPSDNICSEKLINHIVQVSFAQALNFDLLNPPYELIEEVSVEQMLSISADLRVKTSKRLGFKQSNHDKT
ncbi:MAG: hypothetical protein ACI9XP_000606 [Lentimonas sp.]|jgi:hypothetical protein